MRKEAAAFTCTTPTKAYTTRYTAASVSTYRKWSQTYGRYEFRAKFPAATTRGVHGALWLWPDNALKYGPWPLSGEIDVAEVYSLFNDRAIPFVHYWPGRVSQTNNYCLLKVTDWHTYTLEWTTTSIKISFDGHGVRERNDHAGRRPSWPRSPSITPSCWRSRRASGCTATGWTRPSPRLPGHPAARLRPSLEVAPDIAVNRDFERRADGAHPFAAENAESLDQDGDRDALHRIEVDGAPFGDGIVARLKDDLAGQTADRGRARRNQRAPQPGDRRVAG